MLAYFPRFISLQTKLAVATLGVLAIVSSALYFELTAREYDHLVSAKVSAGSMVADLLALSLTAPLDFNDKEAVDVELAKVGSNGELTYVAVTDASFPGAIATLDRGLPGGTPLLARNATEPLRVLPDRVELGRNVVNRRGEVIGRTALVFSLASENAEYRRSQRRIFWYCALMGVGTAAVLASIARSQVLRPLATLARAAGQIERGERNVPVALRSNDELGRLGSAFDAMGGAIADKELRLESARRELRDLFDHMRQAIVAFGADGRVRGDASRLAKELFGEPLEGEPICKALFGASSETSVEAMAFACWIDLAFASDAESWGELSELAPREMMFTTDSGVQIPLELEFRPVTVDGRIERIMLLATDVAEKRHLEQTVMSQGESHAQQMAAMRRLIASGTHVFVSFLESTRLRIDRGSEILARSDTELLSRDIDELFRSVHTTRAEARAFEMDELAGECSSLEADLSDIRDAARGGGFTFAGDSSVRGRLATRLARARGALARGEQFLVEASPIGRAVLDQVTVQRSDVERLVELAARRPDDLAVKEVAMRLSARPFGETLTNLLEAAPRWAEHDGKQIRFEVTGRETPITPSLATVLPGVLAHLIRNAISHGIETVVGRDDAGKGAVGTIRTAACLTPDGAEITVEDDGRGIDLNMLLERATSRGDVTASRGTELAFLPGMSTALETTELSGRGVGLDAVRSDLAMANYQVVASTSPGKSTRFVLRPMTPTALAEVPA